MKRALVALLFFAALVGIWQAVVASGRYSILMAPPPASVAAYLLEAFANGDLLSASWVTGKRLFIGYLIGCAIGLPLGLATARSRFLNDTIGVLALGLQTLPSVCWVPLAMLWFGLSAGSIYFVVIMGTLWSVLIAVDNGVKNLPPIYTRAARTMGSTGLHTLIKVVLPASLPYVISGMKQGWAFAWRSLMAAEIFISIADGHGLGRLLHFGREHNHMGQVIGVMLVIVLIGLLADKLLFSPWENFIHRRWGTARN